MHALFWEVIFFYWTAWTKIAVTEFDEFVESYYDYYAIIAIPNEMYRDFQILLESEL